MTASPVDPNNTYVIRIQNTPYGAVLKWKLTYETYVHRPGLSGTFHDCIVLRAKVRKDLGYITLELSTDRSQIIAMSREFQGESSGLKFKGEVNATLEELATTAMNILIGMGSYNVVNNNCQDFCNTFLERVDLKSGKYVTTAAIAKYGTAAVLFCSGQYVFAVSVASGALDKGLSKVFGLGWSALSSSSN